MKKIYVYLFFLIIFCLWTNLSYGEIAPKVDLKGIEEAITSHINLINKIIKDPKVACMKNWVQLGNPYDEIELLFYMNSISDGTISAYDKKSKTLESLTKHSQSVSQNEPSIVLQYLRLSLLAYNQRPSSESPVMKLLSVNLANTKEVIAECIFKVNDISGNFIPIPSKIIFDLDNISTTIKKNNQIRLYLQKIYIGDRIIYGWWQKMI